MSTTYSTWVLEDLRVEADRRNIRYSSKDGVKTLAYKLRRTDRRSTGGSSTGEGESTEAEKLDMDEEKMNGISFEQKIQLLELERKIRLEERQAERETEKMKLEAEREVGKMKLEAEREVGKIKLEAEREKRESEERVAQLKLEAERTRQETERQIERDRREAERERRDFERERAREEEGKKTSATVIQERPKFIKIREMRESEDIDDYFRIFEMTAKAQFLPGKDWIGNLIPKLTEKAKSAYLEIPETICQDYDKSKSVIIKAYQLTADHYRYRFRTSEKRVDEDFVQWGNRTRRYLNRWMAVAKATGNVEKILEQIILERLLDAVGPELRTWLKDQKLETAEELGNLANLHVQSRKGPMVAGRYVSQYKYSKPGDWRKPNEKPEETTTKPDTLQKPQSTPNTSSPTSPPTGRSTRPPVKCYKCGKEGHMSFNCNRGRGRPSQGYLLCMTPLTSNAYPESPGCYVKGKIEGKPAVMLIDSGCTNTLVHKKFLNHKKWTGNRITVLTATGERITVPLALLSFESEQGRHEEMVGVTDKLPVDCLLGRSSYGKSLAKQNILDQWEKNVPSDSSGNRSVEDEAFVLTRRQALEIAQQRADDLIDRENELSLKSLAKPDTKSEELKEGDLAALFEDEGKPDLTSCESFGKETPVSEVPSNILDRTRTQLISDQKSDVTLEKVRKRALEKVPENEDGYFLDQELLLHRKIVKDLPESIRFMDRIVVPEAYRNEILRVAHTIPLAGHMGVKKTTDRITMHFFWPGVTFDIKKYCATCPQCQLVARKLKSNRAPLKPTEIITEPFKKVAIDLVGELPKSATGYKYILTIVDYATRYPEAIPLRTTSSKVIADALIQFFSRVGIPEELVSDQGSNFIGKLMTELYENLGITKIKTSVYHPEGNGLVERFHSTLKAMLKKFVGECVNTWDKYLPYLLFAYREVPSESIGYSPFELLYGHTIRGPLSVIKEAWLEKRPDRSNMTSYVLEMRKKLSTMQQVVQKNLDKAQGKQKQIYDAHSSRRKFDVGDKALVLLPTPGSKLEVKWQGPYTVTKVLKGGLNYELDTVELEQVLQRLRECKLNARPSKCKIAMSSVDFVGHKVGGDKIEPRAALVQAIERFPRPQTKKQVKSFIGLVGYYRKFIPNFSERAAVLTDLTKGQKPTKLVWQEQQESAFQDLKNALRTSPVLRPPHWNEPFILQVDASNRGLACIVICLFKYSNVFI